MVSTALGVLGRKNSSFIIVDDVGVCTLTGKGHHLYIGYTDVRLSRAKYSSG